MHTDTGPHATRPLRIATYNIHGCVGLDRRRDVARVARVISALRVDVCALQEVDGRKDARQLASLAARTGLSPISGPTMRTASGDYGNALLTRLEVVETKRCDLSIRGREPRGLLDVSLRYGTGVVRVVNTHLGLRRRERSAQWLLTQKQLENESADVCILLGDFNEWLPGPWLGEVEQRMGPSPRIATFPAAYPVLSLDRIWVQPHTALRLVTTPRGLRAKTASDHLPLLAEVRV